MIKKMLEQINLTPDIKSLLPPLSYSRVLVETNKTGYKAVNIAIHIFVFKNHIASLSFEYLDFCKFTKSLVQLVL